MFHLISESFLKSLKPSVRFLTISSSYPSLVLTGTTSLGSTAAPGQFTIMLRSFRSALLTNTLISWPSKSFRLKTPWMSLRYLTDPV